MLRLRKRIREVNKNSTNERERERRQERDDSELPPTVCRGFTPSPGLAGPDAVAPCFPVVGP